MTHKLHAPPLGTVFEDTPYGHALIEFYKPWILANALNPDVLVDREGDSLGGYNDKGELTAIGTVEKKSWLPWTVLKTNESLSYLFIQDETLPMAVPPIGTVSNEKVCQAFVSQYPAFDEYLDEIYWSNPSDYYKYLETGCGWRRIIAHPPHSVVVPFVKPVEAETEAQEPKESDKPTMPQPIVTTVQKILRPEIGQLIETKEEVDKFRHFLLLNTGDSDCVIDCNGCYLISTDIHGYNFLPYTVEGINHDYEDIFITEAELAQAQAEAQTVIPVSNGTKKSHLLPTAENIRDYAIDLESNFSKSLSVIKENINDLFERLGESKPF